MLDLRFNDVGPEGARALFASPHLAKVERLYVWGNRGLEGDGMDALRERFGDRLINE